MQFTTQTSADGIIERHFRLGEAPGVLWSAEEADDPRPLILIGHGGSQHKTALSVRARARRFVTVGKFAAAAIDAPGHGERPRTAGDEKFIATIRVRLAAGERPGAVRAFGPGEKTLHANPGRHREVPGFELDSSVRFFSRHLSGPGESAA